MTAISVRDLVKSYGSRRAVDGISFEVDQGEVFGMLGPNGAGKTTTVEILEGLRQRDSGRVEVLGRDVAREGARVRDQIGVALQSTSLLPRLTPIELLELFGSFFSHHATPATLLNRMDLQEQRHQQVQTLSGGQQQRLCVALALVNDPRIVFLDEPTTGLDPQSRHSLWEVIEEMRSAGRTVMLTTHYMEEAERLCDRVAIVDAGRILALDTPKALIGAHSTERAIQFQAPPGYAAEEFCGVEGALKAAAEDGDMVLYSSTVQRTLGGLLEWAQARNVELGDIQIRRSTLEDVFIRMTGRRIRP